MRDNFKGFHDFHFVERVDIGVSAAEGEFARGRVPRSRAWECDIVAPTGRARVVIEPIQVPDARVDVHLDSHTPTCVAARRRGPLKSHLSKPLAQVHNFPVPGNHSC